MTERKRREEKAPRSTREPSGGEQANEVVSDIVDPPELHDFEPEDGYPSEDGW